MELEMKFKRELETFFRLTILNLVIAAVVFGVGISLAINQLESVIGMGGTQVLSVILLGLGVVILAGGFYWLITTVGIMSGVGDIKKAYEEARGDRDAETVTGLVIKMTAYYRSNQSTISRMAVLGKVSGVVALAAGIQTALIAALSIVSDGFLVYNSVQFLGGAVMFGVGTAGLFIADKFNKYSKIWNERLRETAGIEDALRQKLEAD